MYIAVAEGLDPRVGARQGHYSGSLPLTLKEETPLFLLFLACMQGRVITVGNRTVHSDPHIHQVQGSVLCRLRGKIPLQHPPRSKRSPHLLVSAARITHGYARGLWPGSRIEDPHVVIAPAPAQPETFSIGSCQLAAPGRAGVGLYPIVAGRPAFDSSTPPPD